MFRFEKFIDKKVLKSSLTDGLDAVAFFTTRELPLKAGEREDLMLDVEKNKEFLCRGLNIPQENLFIPVQTHSDNVGVISNLSHLVTQPHSHFENTDALVTNLPNIAIALNFADCVPVILYDPIKKVAAIAHAGWKGTASGIVKKTVKKMVEEFSADPKDIIALIGPSIGKCCFEVQEDVAQKLLQTIVPSGHASVYENGCIDLKLVNKFQLLSSGVEKIDLCEYCTCCKTDLFFSYRKENKCTARHSAVIMLKQSD